MKSIRTHRPNRQPQIDLRIRTNLRGHDLRFYPSCIRSRTPPPESRKLASIFPLCLAPPDILFSSLISVYLLEPAECTSEPASLRQPSPSPSSPPHSQPKRFPHQKNPPAPNTPWSSASSTTPPTLASPSSNKAATPSTL